MFSSGFLKLVEIVYKFVIYLGNHLQSFFLLAVRVIWGSQLWITGVGKLMSLDRISLFFSKLQIPAPYFSAIIVGTLEAIGGLFLVLGFSSRLVCIPLFVILTTAYATAHTEALQDLILNPAQFAKEAPFPFLLTVLIVFIFGPGRISIDAWIKKRLNR